MDKLPKIILLMITNIFESQVVELTASSSSDVNKKMVSQLHMFRVKDEMIRRIESMYNAYVSVIYKNNGEQVFSFNFKTPGIYNKFMEKLELEINPMWDGFDIYRIVNQSQKEKIYHFKI